MRRRALILFWLMLAVMAGAHPLGPPNADSITTFQLLPNELKIEYAIAFKEASALTIIPQLDQNQDGELSSVETAAYTKSNQ